MVECIFNVHVNIHKRREEKNDVKKNSYHFHHSIDFIHIVCYFSVYFCVRVSEDETRAVRLSEK